MIRIDWINVAFVVIIVGGLLLIAATAQVRHGALVVDSRTPRGDTCMRRRIPTACAAGRFGSSRRITGSPSATSRRR